MRSPFSTPMDFVSLGLRLHGQLSRTLRMRAPMGLPVESFASSISRPRSPAAALTLSESRSSKYFAMRWIGIENDAPVFDGPSDEPPPRSEIIPLMPMSSPDRFQSGPPELPGFTSASCMIAPA